jgi:hypothetical protein
VVKGARCWRGEADAPLDKPSTASIITWIANRERQDAVGRIIDIRFRYCYCHRLSMDI